MSTLRYNLRLVAKSLRRDRWFTAIMVVTQALAVSIFVTALLAAQRYSAMTGQIAPDVYRVEGNQRNQLIPFFKGTSFEGFGELSSVFVSLPTARALAADGAVAGHTINFIAVTAGGPAGSPAGRLPVRFCEPGLFELFKSELRYGRPWRREEESAATPPVVLTDLLNERLYGGANSVGRTIQIAGRDFRIAGVMRQRAGKLHMWDFGVAPENLGHVMVPLSLADTLRPVPVIAWPTSNADQGWASMAASSSAFVELWVRLPSEAARARFAAAMQARDPDRVLRSASELAARYAHPPAPYRVFVILTLVVLEASVINVMRMLLAKATSRAAEIGVHRALGAGRDTIFVRQLLEGVVVSMAGSVLGLALAVPTVRAFDRLVPDSPVLLAFTPGAVATTFLVCLFAGIVSGIYPAWRVASVPPTRYLGKV